MTTEISRSESPTHAGGGSPFGALLGGMLGSPVRRSEFAETPQGPAGFDLGDDVDQVGTLAYAALAAEDQLPWNEVLDAVSKFLDPVLSNATTGEWIPEAWSWQKESGAK